MISTRLTRKQLFWLIVAGAVLLTLVTLGLVYRRFLLSGLDIVAQATGGRPTAALTILGALLVLVWLVVWILFPLIVYLGLRDLRKRTSALDQTTRDCAKQLARLNFERNAPQNALREEPKTPDG